MKSEIVDSFSQMVKDKKIDRDLLESIIKEVFGMMIKKKYGQNANYDVIVNMDKGDIEMYLSKAVVETVADPETEITVEEANERSGEELEVGDDYTEVLDYVTFGRRHIVNLKQNLNQKIREVEKEIIYNDYKDLVGEIIVGEIYQIKPHSILLIHNGHEIQFPKGEQIARERYKKGESIRVYVKEVSKKSSGPPSIIVSRSADDFLKKLFELEIPEIYDGVIEIKGVSREPGERAKVAVYSYDDRIDAVGACVGMKGIRIHSIVRELANENIDVINYSDDIGLYIARALAPAKLKDIYLDKANKVAKIVADEDQISLIIGKNGQNIKLASKLTDYEIDVERNSGRPKDIEEALERELELQAEEAENEELEESEETAENEDENIPKLPKDMKDSGDEEDEDDDSDDEEDDDEEDEEADEKEAAEEEKK
ncbi:MAG TPA: transcription termination factor NusA [Ignavibacteria bacterium]|nr:transcription termination factor NusA [Ignavibacteria bacterium]HRE09231.1 transcription termination factor NusA [Ignavibacteria bacterium]HRF66193.1 transcription termination factor NusA [Ignavibacteria bacterium]HRJ05679.1 transcription termination factor NusA [Ignavibacteria bacterium]HRJ86366.1 transcription termination factor NusA [Ignavibacteria bacterium]